MDVLMPQLGETVAEGKITKWFKSAGDAVKPGDNLFEIETDKVSMEVPSITAGTLTEIRVQDGEVAQGRRRGRGDRGRGRRRSLSGAGRERLRRRRRAHRLRHRAARTRGRRRVQQTMHQAIRPARSVLRGAHAGAQFRPGQDRGRRVGDAAGAPARRRERHRPVAAVRLGSARPHRRCGYRGRDRQRAAGAPRPRWRPARRPRRSRRSIRASSSRRCRSTACARTIAARLVEAKQTIPHFYLTADVTMDALLQAARGGQRRRAGQGRRARPTSSRSTTSSSRRWRSPCSACRRRTRCGRATASCASSIPTSASRSRSRAGCSRR